MVDWSVLTTRRTLLALATVAFSLTAAGAGITAVFDGQLDQTPAPDGPTVTSTPTETTTTSDSATGDSSSTETTTTVEPGPDPASLEITVDDPPDVENFVGDVDALNGNVSGTVSWSTTDAEQVAIVVSTWVPGEGWVEKRRETMAVSGAGQTTIGRVFDTNNFTFVEGARADVFDNPDGGTTKTNQGYVAVTVLVDDGEGVARSQELAEYTVSVSNVDVEIEDVDVSLETTGTTLLEGANVVPGGSGTNSIELQNTGPDPGVLDVVIEDFDADEGGITEPEEAVDSPDIVELASALELRVVVVRDDGTTTYLAGGPTSFVPLYELSTGPIGTDIPLGAGERLELRAEWRIDTAVGNEIQSDSVGVDLSFVLTGT